jgi:RNA polymerase sigma factor (sigma-70 family)
VRGERISAREAEELSACFAAHARWLFGYACVLLRGDSALADDLVQAAFEAAARAWCTVGMLSGDQQRAWLRTTLTNIAISGFRREAAFRDRLPQIEARYRAVPADTAGEALSSMAMKRCWQIISAMPERQHAVAMLRWHQGMKEAEIAAALGMAEKTVVRCGQAWRPARLRTTARRVPIAAAERQGMIGGAQANSRDGSPRRPGSDTGRAPPSRRTQAHGSATHLSGLTSHAPVKPSLVTAEARR